MPGLERIVTDIPEGSQSDVANRQPALERVVASAMQQVRDSHGSHGGSRLQAGESCRIVYHIVGEKNLLPPTSLKVASGSIVHTPSHSNSGKEPQICAIPEGVRRRSGLGRLSCRERSQHWFRGITQMRFGW